MDNKTEKDAIQRDSNSDIVEKKNSFPDLDQEDDFLSGLCPYNGSTEPCESCQ